MKCPYCGNPDTRVIDSRPAEDNSSIRRRRSCDECGKRFTTYEKVVKEEARLTEQRVELDEEELERLDQSLQYLKKRLQDDRETNPDVKITYFCADQKKEGGQYRTVQGKVRRIRQYEKAVELEDRTAIPIKDIVQILVL